jgi:hypothetical protein
MLHKSIILCALLCCSAFGDNITNLYRGQAIYIGMPLTTVPSAGGGPVALPVPVIHDRGDGTITFYPDYSIIPVNGLLEASSDGITGWSSVGSGVITDGGEDVFDLGFGYNDNSADLYYRLTVSKTGWLDSTSAVVRAVD